ncbi:type VI secretion system baseplate subunit TssK [Larsenimonas suaedae]|uniref:Type VI secretion system baseplate subunit TssK n=1 Tax=Larsenimonas suaedae TaxID=1851019 RepID=A0ABU1GVN4_9GAMM|nr:type VI secretion system baseplate subunit TssK [Larsenimonas suaedae]MCM2973206.1 type VI secretion system baseplate subunit TssK [Larsenimonas suaedae]MDR5896099.1 type VI secretion system baseplate subunit TssK [Larsenimonas suaedae]
MSSRNRVIWNEGLFIKPQHFQQQSRALEAQLNERLSGVSRYLYGFTALELNAEYLSFGRIALARAEGVFPDGTAFSLPHDDALPDPLEIHDGSVANQIVYLALPMVSDSLGEVQWPESGVSARFSHTTRPVRDLHSESGDYVDLDLAQVAPRLMLERDDRSAYATLAVGRILEKRADGSLVMDQNFFPTLLNVLAAPVLHRFVGEMAGLMRERARNIANRISAPSQGSVADVSDFMLLQLLNRTHPQFQHLSRLSHLHPERLFETLVSTCGELMTFTDESRLPQEYPSYDHDYPEATFSPLMLTMRQALSTVLESRAVAIQLQKRRYGLMVAPLTDTSLLDSAEFILAVRAEMPLERLRKQFVQQTKIASVERIRDLISLQLPGVPLTPLPVAPRQLPYHAGYTYFQLDRQSQAWDMLRNASGFAFHVAGEFPGLELQFWAIRS